MSAQKKADVIDLNAARRRLRTCQPKVFAYDHQSEWPDPALCGCWECKLRIQFFATRKKP